MALALARFLFGFSVSWIAAAILLVATLICIRLIGIVVHAFDNENTENFAGGCCVLIVSIGALVGIYTSANALHNLIGGTASVSDTPNWLAGSDNLSAMAVLGALVGVALMGAIPFIMNRRNASPEAVPNPKKAPAQTRAKVEAAKASVAKASLKKEAAPKGLRIGGLGWTALFLLLMAAAIFFFAFSLDPNSLAHVTGQPVAGNVAQRAARAHYVYIAAEALLGASALFFILWLGVRRR
jgi:hypothetical protein